MIATMQLQNTLLYLMSVWNRPAPFQTCQVYMVAPLPVHHTWCRGPSLHGLFAVGLYLKRSGHQTKPSMHEEKKEKAKKEQKEERRR